MGGEISAAAALGDAVLGMFLAIAEWTGAIVIIITALAVLFLVTVVTLEKRKIAHRVTLPSCPCCTTRPMESDDCTCREDCGVAWCQAADPELDEAIERILREAGRG